MSELSGVTKVTCIMSVVDARSQNKIVQQQIEKFEFPNCKEWSAAKRLTERRFNS